MDKNVVTFVSDVVLIVLGQTHLVKKRAESRQVRAFHVTKTAGINCSFIKKVNKTSNMVIIRAQSSFKKKHIELNGHGHSTNVISVHKSVPKIEIF